MGETSYERFARKGKNPRIYSAEYDSDNSDGVIETDSGEEDQDNENLLEDNMRKKRPFCANCKEMCCRKKVVSQRILFDKYTARAKLDKANGKKHVD